MRAIFEMISTDPVLCYIPCFMNSCWKNESLENISHIFPNSQIFSKVRGENMTLGFFFIAKHSATSNLMMCTWAPEQQAPWLCTWASTRTGRRGNQSLKIAPPLFERNLSTRMLDVDFWNIHLQLLTSHEVKEARPAAEDGDEDDEESRDLGHHLQLVPRGV